MNHEEYLTKNGLPLPPYLPITKFRWIAGNGDYWAKTPKGWYWLRGDAVTKEWKHAPMGPVGETS